MTSPPDNNNVPRTSLILTPSHGLGGGIESYAQAIVAELKERGIRIEQLSLVDSSMAKGPPLSQKLLYALRVLRRALALRPSERPAVYVFHPSLALLGALARRISGSHFRDSVLFFHGDEIWSSSWTQRRTWRHCGMRRVTVSAFSAGALASIGPASVLPPGIPHRWYEQLCAIGAERTHQPGTASLNLLSVFRLQVAAEKGVCELLQALDRVRARGASLRLTLAGVGPAPAWLVEAVRERREWVYLAESPTRDHLAELFSSRDLFVLATRLDPRSGSGEGFGIVLVEAALSAMPVVAPPLDGSSDAILPGITALRPSDGSVEALEGVVEWCAHHPETLSEMGRSGYNWSSTVFSPIAYSRRVGEVLFLEQPDPALLRVSVERARC